MTSPEPLPAHDEPVPGSPVGDLPPFVAADLDEPVRDLWRRRAKQHLRDVYAGVKIQKYPEDLRAYEHALWLSRATAVVELGAHHGGSTLWFRDRLATFARYHRPGVPIRVVAVDLEPDRARAAIAEADPGHADTIVVLEGDVLDPGLPARVAAELPDGARPLIVEDTLHAEHTTRAALEGFAPLVPVGGFLVVEDGLVDHEELRLRDDWPRGVLPALRAWLATPQGRDFRVRRDFECYGISGHPEGFLERVR